MTENKECPFCGKDCHVSVEHYSNGDIKKWSCPDHRCLGYNDQWFEEGDWELGERKWNERHERTCTVEYSESAVMDHMHLYRWWRLSCGHEMMTATEPPRYCEECGAKVVE